MDVAIQIKLLIFRLKHVDDKKYYSNINTITAASCSRAANKETSRFDDANATILRARLNNADISCRAEVLSKVPFNCEINPTNPLSED